MEYMQIAESSLLYTLVTLGVITVILMTLLFLKKSWKRACELGFTHEELMNVVKSTLTFSIVPSLAIVVGFFTLIAMLGVPWSWFRLSVIGSVGYEILAANMGLSSLGRELSEATLKDFTLIMYIMSISIVSGLIIIMFTTEKIQNGTMKLKKKDPKWGALANSCYMLTIAAVLLTPMILKGGVTLLTLLSSALIAIVLKLLAAKGGQKWLNNFILALSLSGAMASSVFWSHLLH